MALTRKQKKYLKKNLKKKSPDQIVSHLGVSSREIESYLKKIWGEKKYHKFVSKTTKKPAKSDLKERVLSFNFKTFLQKNWKVIGLLTLLVLIAYTNSLGNEFVSDDVSSILNNKKIGELSFVFARPPTFIQDLSHFICFRLFGPNPFFFRLPNLLLHLGTILVLYLLVSLFFNTQTALFSASIFAVHPLLIEAVTWISGGSYSKYAFFLMLSLLFFIFSLKEEQKKKHFILSMLFFLLALVTSEKAMVFPVILLFFLIGLGVLRKNWKKLIVPFFLSGCWFLIYAFKIPGRVSELETGSLQKLQTLNPLWQIPISVTSYLELIFWPKNLTLYHSEMSFSQAEYFLRLTVFLVLLSTIIFAYKKNRQVFFWLSFFLISLLPTLTPFGISWIVAERYVYLGSIGVFVVIGLGLKNLAENKKFKPLSIALFCLILIALTLRTIRRNIDWKNQDNLWLAAAKTSPSSPQNHNNLGDLYGRHGDLERAAREFKIAIELKPGYADAYHNLANTYRQMGKVDGAIENYQNAIRFNPGLWQSYQNLAALYFEQEKFDLALDHLKKATEVNPKNADLFSNLGVLYQKIDQQEKAEQAFENALKIDPQNLKAKQLLLQVH